MMMMMCPFIENLCIVKFEIGKFVFCIWYWILNRITWGRPLTYSIDNFFWAIISLKNSNYFIWIDDHPVACCYSVYRNGRIDRTPLYIIIGSKVWTPNQFQEHSKQTQICKMAKFIANFAINSFNGRPILDTCQK